MFLIKAVLLNSYQGRGRFFYKHVLFFSPCDVIFFSFTYVLGLIEIFILAKRKKGVPVFVFELFREKVGKKFGHLEYRAQTGS